MVEGLDSPPMIFQAYNPPYYRGFFERYGFARELDYLAYRFDPDQVKDRSRAVAYASESIRLQDRAREAQPAASPRTYRTCAGRWAVDA